MNGARLYSKSTRTFTSPQVGNVSNQEILIKCNEGMFLYDLSTSILSTVYVNNSYNINDSVSPSVMTTVDGYGLTVGLNTMTVTH
jgi:hypothetical protein